MTHPDIMIVDDDLLVREISSSLLADAGYRVVTVEDSFEAVALIRKNKPKLVIVDIMMPGVTGMDICKSIKTDPELRHIKVVVCSAKCQEAEKHRAYRLGADYYLQKPYNVESYTRTVKGVLEGKLAGGHCH
ncbi:MAG: response regulator [Elusimicrobiales bacterium]